MLPREPGLASLDDFPWLQGEGVLGGMGGFLLNESEFAVWGGGLYMRENRYDLANWRSYSRLEAFFGPTICQGQTSAEWKSHEIGHLQLQNVSWKWREIRREKFWALSSFISWGKRSSKISPEISQHFPWQLPRTVSGENFTAALLHTLQGWNMWF